MNSSLPELVGQLLKAPDAGAAKPLVDKLIQALCTITGQAMHPPFFWDEDASLTARGKAVSPTTAAQCAEDIERTRVFMQGVYAAIQAQLGKRGENNLSATPVQILYAGTGPFGLLLVPLLPLFNAHQLRVTLLDIHAESLAKVKTLVNTLELDWAIAEWVVADACEWQTDKRFDLIISETMRQGLIQEPQVSVFAHLQQFLAAAGELIPQQVVLDLWLANAGAMAQDAVPLGEVFCLDLATARRIASEPAASFGRLTIPDYPAAIKDLKLSTRIQVFGEYGLSENQSQLTLPIYYRNARPTPASELTYSYELGAYPHMKFEFTAIAGEENLADFAAPNRFGLLGLTRFWHKAQWQKQGRSVPLEEWSQDRQLLDLIGLGLEPSIEQAFASDSLNAFEDWVSQTLMDKLNPERVAQINLRMQGDRKAPDCALQKNITASRQGPLTAEQLEHWQREGYVIVPGVLSEQQAAEVRAAIWQHLGMDESDPGSWYRAGDLMKKVMVQLFDHPSLEVARRSETVRAAFAQLWGCDELVASTDRVGFNPPETAQWKFPGPPLHWDLDALEAPVPFGTQGLIYLTDTSEEQGAFSCVPGFHQKIDQWLADYPQDQDPAQQDWSQWPVKPIAARAGDLIIWHQALPHGPSANRAAYPRMVQYLNMYP